MIVAIVVTLLVGLLVVLVITNQISKSRDASGSDYYPYPGDLIHHESYLVHANEVESRGQDSGDWGGRDMSHDDHADTGDHGGGGDWGGDGGSGGE